MGLFTVNLKQVFRHLDATFPKFAVRARGCGAPFGLIYAVNPAMIIAGVPVVAAATAHRKHFDMIFVGSWISATAPFFLAFSQTVVRRGGLRRGAQRRRDGRGPAVVRLHHGVRAAGEGGRVRRARARAPFPGETADGHPGGCPVAKVLPGEERRLRRGKRRKRRESYRRDERVRRVRRVRRVASSRVRRVRGVGIIGLVTATSPLCIAAFHGWLKDSGVEPPIESKPRRRAGRRGGNAPPRATTRPRTRG